MDSNTRSQRLAPLSLVPTESPPFSFPALSVPVSQIESQQAQTPPTNANPGTNSTANTGTTAQGALASAQPSHTSYNPNAHTHIPLPLRKNLTSRLHQALMESDGRSAPRAAPTSPLKTLAASTPCTSASSTVSLSAAIKRRPESVPSSPALGSANSGSTTSMASTVKETSHISIDYDPVSGRKVLNTYEVIRSLGRGQHGKVKLGRDVVSNEYVAIKIVDRTGRPRLGRAARAGSTQEDKIKREIAILKKCHHPNIVELREVLDDASSRKIYLVLEYVENGEVVWQTETGDPALSRSQSKAIARDVLLGLEYLHFQGIIHRDIKPANLLVAADGHVKISDFGVSYAVDWGNTELELAKTAGTPAFFAPELCITGGEDGVSRPVTHKIDIWAFGVTLFCFLYGQVPFLAESEYELFSVIVNQPLVFPDSEAQPPAAKAQGFQPLKLVAEPVVPTLGDADGSLAKDLLCKLLHKDPSARIELDAIKRHPWISDGLAPQPRSAFLNGPPARDRIEVSGEEVREAVQGISGKIKRGLSRFGSTALQLTGLRRRQSSASSSSLFGSPSVSRSSSVEPGPRSHSHTNSLAIADLHIHTPPSSLAVHSPPSSLAFSPSPSSHEAITASVSRRSSASSASGRSMTFSRKTIVPSSSSANLNALLESPSRQSRALSVGSSATANTLSTGPHSRSYPTSESCVSSPSSEASSVSGSSDDDDSDNGELTLVLGPQSRPVAVREGILRENTRARTVSRPKEVTFLPSQMEDVVPVPQALMDNLSLSQDDDLESSS